MGVALADPPPPDPNNPGPPPADQNGPPPPAGPGAAPPADQPPAPGAPPPGAPPEAPPPGAPSPDVPPGTPPPGSAPPAPAPESGRTNVTAGGFSYVLPPGWAAGDASRISYGQAVLVKVPPQGQTPPADTSILLGKLDLRLFAGAEPDNQKAAIRLASDMGEFYMPFPGTRINQSTEPLDAGGMPGASAYYEVKFTDANKPNGQIWTAAVGTNTPRQGTQPAQNNRWFVVWLGSATNPIDKAAAKALVESIRQYTPPPPPPAADPGAPGAPEPNAPQAPGNGAPAVGVPRPIDPASAPGMVPPS
jgi:hypothetical protein